jgi:nucleotide-binding universal stress UspA family protein
MSETIVVGTDGSETAEQAVQQAARLTKALGGELHIVTAFKPLRGARVAGVAEGAAAVWQPLPDDRARAIIEEAAAGVRMAGLEPHCHLVEKDPADALLEVAREVDATMIVVGSQGMSGPRRLLGSVPNKVAHEAKTNVLIVATRRAPQR